jgi:hypothetical protein
MFSIMTAMDYTLLHEIYINQKIKKARLLEPSGTSQVSR